MANSFRKNASGLKRTLPAKILFAVVFAFFLLYAAMLIYPVVWGFFASVKSIDDYLDHPMGFPKKCFFSNYGDAIDVISEGGITFPEMAWNSIWYSAGSAWINMEFISAYAYVLNKFKFRGRNFLYGLCLFIMSVPIGASFVSTYRLMHDLNFANSYSILFTATSVYGMNLMLFHSYYSNISNSYMEAAKMDGANFYQIYFKVMRQQATPLALTLGLLLFINKWNDYMSPLLYLSEKPTLSSGLYRFQLMAERDGQLPVLYAGLFMCVLPILVVFAIFSDKMMTSINIGGLKG